MGNQAQVLVQPILKIAGEVAPVDILEDVVITIQTTTEDNIPATTRFEDVRFKLGKDFMCEFPIPAKLREVQFIVDCKVKLRFSGGNNNSNGE